MAETILSKKIIENKKYEKLAFSKYIKEKNKSNIDFSTKELAKTLGVKYEYFRKIINKESPTPHKDLIIALCALLKLNVDETNIALELYGFPTLTNTDDKHISSLREDIQEELIRDNVFISVLTKGVKGRQCINEINKVLADNGVRKLTYNFSKNSTNNKSDYTFKNIEVSTSIDEDYLYFDRYNSLQTEFSPEKYIVSSSMILEKKNHRLLLTYKNNSYLIQDLNISTFKMYNDLDETGKIRPYFERLKLEATKEFKKYLTICFDTKNYISRSSANVVNGKIHLFAEMFNYNIPELSEYYMLEYIDGTYRYTTSHKSQFMKKYLNDKDYSIYYSGEEISISFSKEFTENYTGDKKDIHSYRINKMKTELNLLMEKIRNKDVYIRNINEIYDEYEKDIICKIYDLESEFDLSYDDELGSYVAKKDTIFADSNFGKITITKNDLFRAYELGIDSKEDIIQILSTNKSIDSIIK